MGLETGTYVSDLVASNPLGTDSNAQGDDHIRLLKSVLQATFPNASKAYYFDDVLPVKTGAFTVQASHMNALIPCDTSAVGFTVTLPPVLSVSKGFTVFVVLETAGNTLTVSAAVGEVINGNASVSLNTQYVMLRLVTDGNKWFASYLGTVFYTDAEATQLSANTAKLAGIETGATADQTPAEIKAAYESNADTNAFTDAEKALLANQSGVNTGDEVAATEAIAGVAQLATQAEAQAGVEATKIMTAARVADAIIALSPDTAAPDYALEKAAVVGASTVEFTAEDLSKYYQVKLRFQDCSFAAATGQVIEFSTDGGVTWLASGFNSRAFDAAGTSTANIANIRLVAAGRSSSATGGVLLFEMNVPRRIQSEGITDGKVAHSGYGPAVIPNALRFRATASTFTAGSILLLAWK